MCGPENGTRSTELTQCHRGIFEIEDPLWSYLSQPTLTCEPLGGHLWTVSDGTYRSLFCEGEGGLIAFDTFYSPGAAISYRKALNRLFPQKPIHTIVYSHDHLDHTGFAADLAPTAEIIAHEDCASVIRARAADGQLVPTETFTGSEAEYIIDGVRIELHNPGPTHGNGNLAASFPQQRVLFMVDTVIPGVGYTFLPDWHVAGYVDTMRGLFDDVRGWERFVPGHYWPIDRLAAESNLGYYDELKDAAEQALAEGLDHDDLRECDRWAREKLASQHGRLFRFHEYAGMNLMRMMLHLLEGGWGLEDARPEPRLHRASAAAPARSRTGSGPHEVCEGVTAVEADGVRALAVAAPQGSLCVGTLGSRSAARSLGEVARGLSGGRPPSVILATDHLDQSGAATGLDPKVLLAHELTARALAGKLGADAVAGATLIEGGGGRYELEGLEVDLLYPGPTCGTGTLAVHLPASSLLYVVGPRPDARYGLIPDIHLAGAVQRWRRLLDLEPEVVVFSRGGIGTSDDLLRACDYLDALGYAAQKAFAEGVAVWDVRAMEEYVGELLRGRFGGLDGFDRHIGIGAIRLAHHYLMGGWGLEDAFVPPADRGRGASGPRAAADGRSE